MRIGGAAQPEATVLRRIRILAITNLAAFRAAVCKIGLRRAASGDVGHFALEVEGQHSLTSKVRPGCLLPSIGLRGSRQ